MSDQSIFRQIPARLSTCMDMRVQALEVKGSELKVTHISMNHWFVAIPFFKFDVLRSIN